jgi:hypothetical protein
MSIELSLILWLFVKHFVCDFPLQAFPYMYLNKGKYFHLGGLMHAAVHFYGTTLVLWLCGIPLAVSIWMGLVDYVLHYHIDWAKVKVTKFYNLTPMTSEWFWILLGFDQLLHALTYFYIVYYLKVGGLI